MDVVHRAHRDGMDRPPRQASPTGAERRGEARRVVGESEQRVDAGHRFGTGTDHRFGDVDDAIGVGAELRPPWTPARSGGSDHLGRQRRVVGEDRASPLEVRDTTGSPRPPPPRVEPPPGARPPARSRRRCDPRCSPRSWHRTRRDRRRRGRASTARRDPGDPTAFIIPCGRGMQARRRDCRATRRRQATWSPRRRALAEDPGARPARCRTRRSPTPSSPQRRSSTLPTVTRVSITPAHPSGTPGAS
jgi:hypothetical protein